MVYKLYTYKAKQRATVISTPHCRFLGWPSPSPWEWRDIPWAHCTEAARLANMIPGQALSIQGSLLGKGGIDGHRKNSKRKILTPTNLIGKCNDRTSC